jgi:phosphoglycolate phosphatase-like HAD superfamily hydrolase
MSLRIAFDLDGVLADMEAALVRHAESIFGEEIARRLQPGAAAPPPDGSQETASPDDSSDAQDPQTVSPGVAVEGTPAVTRLRLSPRQERKLWRHIATVENFWETLDETEPGIVSRLAQTTAERRWEIVFLTKRPKTMGVTAQVQSQRWWVSKGFPLPSVYVVQGSRGRIAAALDLDVVFDDRPENCLDVSIESKARAILVWREDEKALPAAARRIGIGVVRSVGDGLDVLTTLDKHDAQKDPGLLARVRKMLGLKEQTGV